MTTRVLSRVVEQGRIDTEKEVAANVVEDEPACSLLQPTSPLQFSANRDWKMLNKRVKEYALEYKTQTQKLNWIMLKIKDQEQIET
ncbi:hypothetical protein DPMN_192685 [Dreissena polymorpha]|uniref:Uncharacterized protein n=1 Tax=Dreissena polymorpha TaxID=45954 RepID=A0A9D3Y654_DREPO|nr:hypothetical protein DPMN_192685 [Dreissena polymorpha]